MTHSHKGENGRALVIGGSKLFHAAAFWAAETASKIVDLVHFSSPAMENNELMRVKAKQKFWSGIVVPYETVEHYIQEDDVILIGPGMPRDEGLMAGEKRTGEIVNDLLRAYQNKKWVLDGGALQEVDPGLITKSMIVTPNKREFAILANKMHVTTGNPDSVRNLAKKLGGAVVLYKGEKDLVSDGREILEIGGGNAGMTKGGTGDVLAGLAAALYAKSPKTASLVTASYVTKKAAETLEKRFSTYYSAGDLIPAVQETLAKILAPE